MEEVFPYPPLREVAFEIRFAPRLRVAAELWRFQDQLLAEYPESSVEAAFRSNGTTLEINVFNNAAAGRLLKVSQQNFAIVFTKYASFEIFKAEVSEKVVRFCQTFGIETVTRVGLRYINQFLLDNHNPEALPEYVRPLLDFERVPLTNIRHFVTEVEVACGSHLAMMRAALIPDKALFYVLDIDCHQDEERPSGAVLDMMDSFHESAQSLFLDHVTPSYKNRMRGVHP
jgi:uncharacterized protein (TIGR04255 family)